MAGNSVKNNKAASLVTLILIVFILQTQAFCISYNYIYQP
jgi:hypothetical protein